ncbi:hypothetical protein WR25_20401 [Diploscapter pachys]|uniref:Uncharacterized protein n=1 Tax=Diploscapter pachys TaxID=2018661 RepID=A0A2A2JLZ5_9BILA|nr:hypothetical protein WR25_20401 [Diploscapter pachys]
MRSPALPPKRRLPVQSMQSRSKGGKGISLKAVQSQGRISKKERKELEKLRNLLPSPRAQTLNDEQLLLSVARYIECLEDTVRARVSRGTLPIGNSFFQHFLKF